MPFAQNIKPRFRAPLAPLTMFANVPARLLVSAFATLFAAYAFTCPVPAHAGAGLTINAYLSAPNSKGSTFNNITTETFSSFSSTVKTIQSTSFSSAIGVYNPSGTPAATAGAYSINPDDTYGTGTGNYFSIGAQSGSSTPVTLTFTNVVQYFGLSYNAGDNNNGFTFYDESNNLIGRYTTAKLVAALKGGQGTVTAVNGTSYNTSFFYGKPTTGAVGTAQSTTTGNTEPYGFLNFVVGGGTGTSGVKKIVFDNSGTTGTGFESDNHTISTVAQSVTGGNYIFVGSTDTPEASTLALLSTGLPLLAGGFAVRKRRQRKGAASIA